LRTEEIAGIEFRNTVVGRQPFVKGTGMTVWEFIMVAKDFDLDPVRTGEHLEYPSSFVSAALNYYKAYPAEIERALEDNDIGEERLRQLIPNLVVRTVLPSGELLPCPKC
jgi:uncharacterized protein (DUF433 family)